MANIDLRPLSLGELLDRTFTLYRQHFVLFAGITAIPQVLILLYNLLLGSLSGATREPITGQVQVAPTSMSVGLAVASLVAILLYFVAYLFAQGGTFFAVSELYLGRAITIGESLGRMRGKVLKLLGVTILNGLVVGAATILLIVPGIYMACRLITCVPAALFEDLGAGESLSRSYDLTKNEAGRAFVIFLLYVVLLAVAIVVFEAPFTFLANFSVKTPGMVHVWTAASQVGRFLARVLVLPYLTIATAVFYYDLRVRKEAFDLQLMMNPGGPVQAPAPGAPPSLA
jgi:hypothetical protein